MDTSKEAEAVPQVSRDSSGSSDGPMSLELLQVLASTPDALVEAEEMYDDDDDAKTPAARRDEALAALDPAVRKARNDAALQLSTRTLKRYVGAPVDDLRAHVTWLARVKPTTLALPTAAPAACASGTLRVVKAQEPHDVAMLFDGRRWHPWTYDAWSTDECCLLYTSPSPRDQRGSRMPSSA